MWYPRLTSFCNEDGLPISEDLYTIITTVRNYIHKCIDTYKHACTHTYMLVCIRYLYTTVIICIFQIPFNKNDTELETIKTYTEKPDVEILDGDPVVILDILRNSSRENCTKEYIEVQSCDVMYLRNIVAYIYHPTELYYFN